MFPALRAYSPLHAVREATDLPVQVQIEPPDDFDWFTRMKASGVEALGLHLEVWDEEVLARVAPGKHAQGREYYLSAWERAVKVFGDAPVSDQRRVLLIRLLDALATGLVSQVMVTDDHEYLRGFFTFLKEVIQREIEGTEGP